MRISPDGQTRPMARLARAATLAAFSLSLCLVPGCGEGGVATAPSPAKAAEPPAPPPPPPAPAPPNPLDEVMAKRTIGDAFNFAGQHMGDTVDEISDGAYLMALWLDRNGSLADVTPQRDETSIAKVKKDSDAERGRRMCVRARISQIFKEKGTGLYSGLMLTTGYDAVSFISFGSTGELVEGSRARFCGLVTGRYSFANVSGGQTQSVQMVGAFDLPENRAAK